MDFIAKAFVFINEFLLFVFLMAPIPFGLFYYFANTPMNGTSLLTFGGFALIYYVFVVALFGWLALAVENNRSLKRIAELLEQQQSDKRRQGPTISTTGPELNAQRVERAFTKALSGKNEAPK